MLLRFSLLHNCRNQTPTFSIWRIQPTPSRSMSSPVQKNSCSWTSLRWSISNRTRNIIWNQENSDILVDAIDRNSKHYAYNSSSIEHSKLTMRRGDGSSENIIFELGTFARLGSISRAFKKLEALTFIALIFLLLKHLRRVSSSGLKDLHSIGTFTESVHLARHQKKPQDNLQFSSHQFPMEIVEWITMALFSLAQLGYNLA